MTPRKAVLGIVLLLLLAIMGSAGILVWKGVTAPVLTGLLVGAGLGGVNLLVESLSLSWALRNKPSATLAVSLFGFFLRLVIVSALIIWFARTKSVSAVAFALAYMASFFVFLALQIWVVSRVQGSARTPAKGAAEGESSG
jgi:cytosine/uracil/thiamine/allantoin permease